MLREIAEEAILPFYDWHLSGRTYHAQYEWHEKADALLEENLDYQAAKYDLTRAYDQLSELVDNFDNARRKALEVLKDVEPPDLPDLPESEFTVDPPDPIFTTADDYVNATLKLKARKGYSV